MMGKLSNEDKMRIQTLHEHGFGANQIKAFISGSEAHKTHTEHTHINGLQTTNLQTTNLQISS